MDALDYIQIVAIIAVVANLIVWVNHYRRNPYERWYTLAALSWLVNCGAFIFVRFSTVLRPDTLNIWSAVIRLQALVLVLGVGLVISYDYK
jgi:hypothetical protein